MMDELDMRQKSVEQARVDFELFQEKRILTLEDEELLLVDLADLIGWYRVRRDEALEELIAEIISFGNSKEWAMGGVEIVLHVLIQ
jgi:hypothetical protein